jgi:fatty acid-binding protein DegV
MPVAVVSDTCHYLPRDVLAEHEIHQVSLYIRWNDHAQRESDLTDYDDYYERLRTATDLPTTSQPSIGDFLAVYEPLLERGDQIVSIHLAGGMSGTVQAAEQARETLGARSGRVHVMDSATACGGQGLVVLAAAAAARSGATALKIKPILTVESEITPVERVRTSRRAFERMVDLLRSCLEDGADGWMVQHIQAPAEAAELAARGRELFGHDPVVISEIGPVIGTHVGPGLLGAGGVPRSML